MKKEQLIQVIKQTLDAMRGHKYKYGGKIHTLKGYNIYEDRDMISVETNLKIYERSLEAAMVFLDQFEPIAETGMEVMPASDALLPVMQINSSVIKDLKDVLMDNIKKVKENKEYIPQATAVKLSVDSIIDLAKIEVAYMEAYVRVQKQA